MATRKRTYRRGHFLGSAKGSGMGLLLLFLLLVVASGGTYLIYDYFKKPKTDPNPNPGNGGGGNTASQLPAGNTTPQLPAAKPQEVANDFFKTNPFAYAATNGGNLNVRSEPSDTSSVVASVANGVYIGKHLGISADTTPGNASTRWAKVTLANGRVGWVFSGYIRSERSLVGSPVVDTPPVVKFPNTIVAQPTATPIAQPTAVATQPTAILMGAQADAIVTDTTIKGLKLKINQNNNAYTSLARVRFVKGQVLKVISRVAPWVQVNFQNTPYWFWDVAIDTTGKVVREAGIPAYKSKPVPVSMNQEVILTGRTNGAAHRSIVGKFFEVTINGGNVWVHSDILTGSANLKGVEEERIYIK